MKPVRFYLGLLFGLMAFQSAFTQAVFIKDMNLFPAYPYNTSSYKQPGSFPGGDFVGCGPTTGAMILGYFQAAHSLTDLLTNPGTGVDKGLNTAWVLHGAAYMRTGLDNSGNGYGKSIYIEPGLENYTASKGYTLKAVLHVAPDKNGYSDDSWNTGGAYGDSWINDAPFYQYQAYRQYKIDITAFCDFIEPLLSNGIAIFLTMDWSGQGGGTHWCALVGFDRTTGQYAYFDTYDTVLHWDDIYSCSDVTGLKARSIAYIRTVTLSLPDIASNPTSWNFGSINLGSYSDKTIVISNSGTAGLTVTAVSLTGTNAQDFGIQSGGGAFALAAGATRNIVVRFTPGAGGGRSASLNIASNDPDENPFTISLSGTGAASTPDIASNVASHNFGSLTLGRTTEYTFIISNAGGTSLSVTATTLGGTNASEFSIPSGGGAFTLAAGATRNLVVRFSPASAGGKSALLSIASNDPDENPFVLSLTGTGTAPDIAVNPQTWSFGAITLGTYSEKTFTIYNERLFNRILGALDVTAVTLSGTNASAFSIQSGGGAFTLLPGDSQNVVVRFTPATAGGKRATLSIASNDPDENPFMVRLTGSGAASTPDIACDPASWDYSSVNMGSSSEKTFVISNTGSAALNVTATSITGTNASEFSIQSGGGSFTLAPVATRDIVVRFSPASSGSKSASLSISSNDPDENPFLVDLSGSAWPEHALIVVDGIKDNFYVQLTGPDNGYLQVKSYAFNDAGIPAGDADLSVKIWTAWDNDWFYLYEEVKDDTLRGDNSNTWGEDELELKFDPQPTDSTTTAVFDTRLTALGMGTAGVVYADSMNFIPDAQKQWVRKTTSDGYILELAIQWSALVLGSETISPAVGNIFGMCIYQHDNDKGFRQASVQWAAVLLNAAWNTPKYFGMVKFLADNKLQFIPTNAMTGRTNPVPYDGTPFYIRMDGKKDPFYCALTGPDNGYLQLRSYAYNENGKPSSDADLSAKIWTAWDSQCFYLYEEVKDDVVSGNAPDVWAEDCLELYVDPQPTDSVNNSDWGARLTALGKASAGVLLADSMNYVPADMKQWVRTTISGGYALELALKWPAINYGAETVTVSSGKSFGMAINQHDNDGNARREATVQWAAVMSDQVWGTPKYLGTVKFLADNRLQFVAKNAMTGRTNPIPYDGSNYTRTGVEDVSMTTPKGFTLEQNYPNPFNPSTVIRYRLPHGTNVALTVYNTHGQQVANLVQGYQEGGYHEVRFDGSNLAGGVYFYRLKAGNCEEMKKLVLIR